MWKRSRSSLARSTPCQSRLVASRTRPSGSTTPGVPTPIPRTGRRGFGDQVADEFHGGLVGCFAHRIRGDGSGIDPLVDPPAEVDQCRPEGSVAEVDGNDVPAAFVEGQQRWGLAARRGSLAQFTEQAGLDEFSNQARDSSAGESGLTGDLGPAGGTPMGDEFESCSQVAATGVVLGGLGVSGQGRVRIALIQIASHRISSPAVDFLKSSQR